MEFIKSESYKNMVQAYRGEIAGKLLYEFLSEKMYGEDNNRLGDVFRQLAHEEDGHVQALGRHLPDIEKHQMEAAEIEQLKASVYGGELKEYLSDFAAGEKKAGEEIYPFFSKVAEEEGFVDIASMYVNLAGVEIRHGEMLAKELAALA